MITLEQFAGDPLRLMALMIGREGRSETPAFRIACGKVAINRTLAAPREGFYSDLRKNILKPGAFSSFNRDPNPKGNGNWFPDEHSPEWEKLLQEAAEVITSGTPDPSQGAVFYFTWPRITIPKDWPPVIESAAVGTDPTNPRRGGHFFKFLLPAPARH